MYNHVHKKLIIAATTLTITLCASEPPSWYDAADDTLKTIYSFIDTFEQEVASVPAINKGVLDAYTMFDVKDRELTFVFDCIAKELQTQLTTISTQTETITLKELEIQQLKNEYDALEFSLGQSIDQLHTQIQALEIQLKESQELYATLVDFNGDKAEELMAAIQSLKTKYANALAIRQEALANIYLLLKRINAFNVSSRVAIETSGKNACGTTFVSELNKYLKK